MRPDLLLGSSIRMSGIVLLALAATLLLRRRSAAVRHWILAAAIACAAGAPVLERVVPVWEVPGIANGGVSFPLVLSLSKDEPQGGRSWFDRLTTSERVQTSPPPAQVARPAEVSYSSLVEMIWLAGAVGCVLVLLVGFGRLAHLASRGRRVEDGLWTRICADVAREYGVQQGVRLLQSDHPALLATWGWRRPIVILPRGAQSWTEDRIRIVLLHELAHVARGDWPIQVLAGIARAIYWFNPFLWIACRRLRQESERAADDAVLNRGVEGSAYASELVTLARAFQAHSRVWLPAPAIARPSTLERRVVAMLNARVNRQPMSRTARIATVAALAAVAVTIVSAQVAFSSLSGAVYDSQDGLLPNVTLRLTNEQTGAKYEIRSDANGRFAFVGLTPGRYALESEALGFSTLRGAVDISGPSLQRDVRLQVGSLRETVTVRLPRPGDPPEPPRTRAQVWTATNTCAATVAPGGIGGNITPPAKIGHAAPQYPANLAIARQGGSVVLDARIGEDGLIREVRTVSATNPEFERAAADAIRQWAFSQTLLNCVAVEVAMRVTVNFLVE